VTHKSRVILPSPGCEGGRRLRSAAAENDKHCRRPTGTMRKILIAAALLCSCAGCASITSTNAENNPAVPQITAEISDGLGPMTKVALLGYAACVHNQVIVYMDGFDAPETMVRVALLNCPQRRQRVSIDMKKDHPTMSEDEIRNRLAYADAGLIRYYSSYIMRYRSVKSSLR
jgi:hypothetical protein